MGKKAIIQSLGREVDRLTEELSTAEETVRELERRNAQLSEKIKDRDEQIEDRERRIAGLVERDQQALEEGAKLYAEMMGEKVREVPMGGATAIGMVNALRRAWTKRPMSLTRSKLEEIQRVCMDMSAQTQDTFVDMNVEALWECVKHKVIEPMKRKLATIDEMLDSVVSVEHLDDDAPTPEGAERVRVSNMGTDPTLIKIRVLEEVVRKQFRPLAGPGIPDGGKVEAYDRIARMVTSVDAATVLSSPEDTVAAVKRFFVLAAVATEIMNTLDKHGLKKGESSSAALESVIDLIGFRDTVLPALDTGAEELGKLKEQLWRVVPEPWNDPVATLAKVVDQYLSIRKQLQKSVMLMYGEDPASGVSRALEQVAELREIGKLLAEAGLLGEVVEVVKSILSKPGTYAHLKGRMRDYANDPATPAKAEIYDAVRDRLVAADMMTESASLLDMVEMLIANHKSGEKAEKRMEEIAEHLREDDTLEEVIVSHGHTAIPDIIQTLAESHRAMSIASEALGELMPDDPGRLGDRVAKVIAFYRTWHDQIGDLKSRAEVTDHMVEALREHGIEWTKLEPTLRAVLSMATYDEYKQATGIDWDNATIRKAVEYEALDEILMELLPEYVAGSSVREVVRSLAMNYKQHTQRDRYPKTPEPVELHPAVALVHDLQSLLPPEKGVSVLAQITALKNDKNSLTRLRQRLDRTQGMTEEGMSYERRAELLVRFWNLFGEWAEDEGQSDDARLRVRGRGPQPGSKDRGAGEDVRSRVRPATLRVVRERPELEDDPVIQRSQEIVDRALKASPEPCPVILKELKSSGISNRDTISPVELGPDFIQWLFEQTVMRLNPSWDHDDLLPRNAKATVDDMVVTMQIIKNDPGSGVGKVFFESYPTLDPTKLNPEEYRNWLNRLVKQSLARGDISVGSGPPKDAEAGKDSL